MTGKTFVPAPETNLEDRIAVNVTDCLTQLAQ